jgi:hypothetical protein
MGKAARVFDGCVAAFALATLGATASCAKKLPQGAESGFLECSPASTDPTGGVTGSLQITGRVRDASGAPVVGARITLGGDAQGFRVSDFGGAYRLRVQPGSYTVTAAGDCSFSPGVTSVQAANAHAAQDFTVAGGDCATVSVSNLSPDGSVLTIRRGGQVIGTTLASVSRQTDQAAGVAPLRDIASEVDAPTCGLTIAGNPATERRARISTAGPQGTAATEMVELTTAIALRDMVVRFESKLAADSAPEVVDLFMAAARAFSPEQVSELRLP